jgi:hypothetical protein
VLNNLLHVSVAEFKLATKVYQRKRLRLGPVLLAYEGGFLSIESGEATAVMNAVGEWHGRAVFSPEILRALALVPPLQDPVQISYDGAYLFIGSMKIICQWNMVSQAFIEDLENPSLIDLLALKVTVPRSEIGGTGLGNKSVAHMKRPSAASLMRPSNCRTWKSLRRKFDHLLMLELRPGYKRVGMASIR